MNTNKVVAERYSKAAQKYDSMPCCPGSSYDKRYLHAIPAEVIERDYGCGDPSKHLRPGDTVLDLGSGGGKMCFVAAQMVGAQGKVIGIDINEDMLALATNAAPKVAGALGYANVEFRKGHIEDLTLDLAVVDRYLAQNPLRDWADLALFNEVADNARVTAPLVASDSVDVVISNCVLNLVSPDRKRSLFREIHRVLRKGGRAVISDVVCDEPVPARLSSDPHLWSGCVSGAMLEDEFVQAFAEAGLYGLQILERGDTPYLEIEGIEFRTMTVIAYKGKEGDCWECNQAVVYNGPFLRVEDDDGHVYQRGQRSAVCEKTFGLLRREPYRGSFTAIEPTNPVSVGDAAPFACAAGTTLRPPAATKATKGDHAQPAAKPGKGCC